MKGPAGAAGDELQEFRFGILIYSKDHTFATLIRNWLAFPCFLIRLLHVGVL